MHLVSQSGINAAPQPIAVHRHWGVRRHGCEKPFAEGVVREAAARAIRTGLTAAKGDA
ncbi:MAG: hypothetical protein HFJ79_03600 [Clostridiales bacterium]|nr:hypothetical protein [Clostridiales bacterium]